MKATTAIILGEAMLLLGAGGMGYQIGHYTRPTPAQVEADRQERIRRELKAEEDTKQAKLFIIQTWAMALEAARQSIQTNR